MSNAREQARSTPNAAELVTAAVALAAGTQAYGDIISFVNPDEGDPGHLGVGGGGFGRYRIR